MYVANSRATTKKRFKKKHNDMLRKEKRWNHIKHSIKTTKGKKRVKKKIE